MNRPWWMQTGCVDDLMAGIDAREPEGLRDYAIMLCIARTGIRWEELRWVGANAIVEPRVRNDPPAEQWSILLGCSDASGVQTPRRVGVDIVTGVALSAWQRRRRELGIGEGPLFCELPAERGDACSALPEEHVDALADRLEWLRVARTERVAVPLELV